MKKSEVPQDISSLDEKKIRELCYVIDEKGAYTTALSRGWEPKTIVQQETIKRINERITDAKRAVAAGKSSPIVYFMELHKMDLLTLSAYVEMWPCRVKRHFKPRIFKRLKTKTLNRYATAFGISITALTQFDGKE